MKNKAQEKASAIAKSMAEMEDHAIKSSIPKWKYNLLKKYKSKLLARLLGVNITIEIWKGGFLNTHKIIKLNGKVIASGLYDI